jgi:hypothetical protein
MRHAQVLALVVTGVVAQSLPSRSEVQALRLANARGVSTATSRANDIVQAEQPGARRLAGKKIHLTRAAEGVLEITASCDGCSWRQSGREGALLRVVVDGRYSQHLVVVRGTERPSIRAMLGWLDRGNHEVAVYVDSGEIDASPPTVVKVSRLTVRLLRSDSSEYIALAHAPILYARPGSVQHWSDLPLVMWYETQPGQRGTWIRYSVIFSNEDGGTPADRLLATWGRLTDIEYIYGVQVDAAGQILAEEYQGLDHMIMPFAGRHEARHAILHVVTDNNMVSDRGETTERFALAPIAFDLTGVAREAVMDAHPWLYRVSSEEAFREGRIDSAARPGSGKVPDPRTFIYIEVCGELEDTTLAFDVAVGHNGSLTWVDSDGGLVEFRIARSGCFRGAVAVPAGDAEFKALRFRAYTRSPRQNESSLTLGSGSARVTRVNRVFRLSSDFRPDKNLLQWTGDLTLHMDGAPTPLPIGPR